MGDATWQDVLAGRARWSVEQADCLDWLSALPDGCCLLAVTSPPFERARTYELGFRLAGQAWVDWVVPRVVQACRVTAGLVCVNMAGQVRDHRYSPVVEWLVADLTRHHGLVCGPAPYCYFRQGIPGSGSKHYHRRDWEPVYCFCRPDRLPLAWSDNTALGHAPRWAPGGEMSNRLSDGTRVNQWGGHEGSGAQTRANGGRQPPGRPSHEYAESAEAGDGQGLFGPLPPEEPKVGKFGNLPTSIGRKPDGTKETIRKSSLAEPAPVLWTNHADMVEHGPGEKIVVRKRKPGAKASTRRRQGSGEREEMTYEPPVLANPGNVVRETYTAEDVRQLLCGGEAGGKVVEGSGGGDVVRCLVGGGQMGSKLAHESEAPFSETLVEFFLRSYAPPDSVVLDPFSGSGTTGAVAVRWGRRFVGCDLRQSQVDLARRRVAGETPTLFPQEG